MDDSQLKRESVMIGPWATDFVRITPLTAHNTITIVIPGNPGVARYYDIFCKELFCHFQGSSAVWAISHTCHSELSINGPTPNSTVDREVQHKIEFIRKFVPRGYNLRLVGHSIGCQMILKALDELNNSDSQFSLLQAYFLFPTIERMKESLQGQKVWFIVNYFWWLPPVLGACVSWLPTKLQEKLASFVMGCGELDTSIAKSLVTTAKPEMLRNMLDLAHDELLHVQELDVQTIEKHKDKIVFYYGSSDHWTPLGYREDLLRKVPGAKTFVCQKNLLHAFVLTQSADMAEELATIIREREEQK